MLSKGRRRTIDLWDALHDGVIKEIGLERRDLIFGIRMWHLNEMVGLSRDALTTLRFRDVLRVSGVFFDELVRSPLTPANISRLVEGWVLYPKLTLTPHRFRFETIGNEGDADEWILRVVSKGLDVSLPEGPADLSELIAAVRLFGMLSQVARTSEGPHRSELQRTATDSNWCR